MSALPIIIVFDRSFVECGINIRYRHINQRDKKNRQMQSNQVNKWGMLTGDTQNLLYSLFDNQYGWSRSFREHLFLYIVIDEK